MMTEKAKVVEQNSIESEEINQENKVQELRQCTGCSKSIYDTERFCGACHNS